MGDNFPIRISWLRSVMQMAMRVAGHETTSESNVQALRFSDCRKLRKRRPPTSIRLWGFSDCIRRMRANSNRKLTIQLWRHTFWYFPHAVNVFMIPACTRKIWPPFWKTTVYPKIHGKIWPWGHITDLLYVLLKNRIANSKVPCIVIRSANIDVACYALKCFHCYSRKLST